MIDIHKDVNHHLKILLLCVQFKPFDKESTMTDKTTLVTGATGETGKYTVENLLKLGNNVKAFVHARDKRSAALEALGAEIVVGDLLNHDDVIRGLESVDTAYFCYPVRPGLIAATAYFADAAKRHDLKLVVNMSQISASEDAESHAARDHWVAERVFDWSAVPTTHLRPTFFAQWLLYPHSRDSIIKEGVIDLPYGTGRHAPIAAEDQARFIAFVLHAPAGHAGKTYNLHGPRELGQAEIAAAVGEVLGREIVYRPSTIASYRERLTGLGMSEFLIQHFCAVALDYTNGIFSGEDGVIGALTGKAPMTVQEFVKAHRSEFD